MARSFVCCLTFQGKSGIMFAENRREDKDMKLLVADDERWIRKGIIKMIDLERFSFEEVLEAGTLKEYEEKFLEARPEIVVSDVRFPNGTSCELCQKLHQKLPGVKVCHAFRI